MHTGTSSPRSCQVFAFKPKVPASSSGPEFRFANTCAQASRVVLEKLHHRPNAFSSLEKKPGDDLVSNFPLGCIEDAPNGCSPRASSTLQSKAVEVQESSKSPAMVCILNKMHPLGVAP